MSALQAKYHVRDKQLRVQFVHALPPAGRNTTFFARDVPNAHHEAKENLTFAEGRYSSGVGNIIELTDAELLAATANAQVVTAHYNYQLAYGRLEVAAGQYFSD